MGKWIVAFAAVAITATLVVLLRPALDGYENAKPAWAFLALCVIAWISVAGDLYKWVFERVIFTRYVHDGYTEEAAWEEVATFTSIRRLARPTQPRAHSEKRNKERQEYERLKKIYEGE